MSPSSLATLVTGVAVAYLLAAYALGGPVMLVRALATTIGERRRRYRGRPDDVLASSRFTIPVSVILPTGGATGIGESVQHLLDFTYPEFEVIVVNDGTRAVIEELRQQFGLTACEVFFRRTLPTGRVGSIFRSVLHDRLLVVDCAARNRADALNCGVNLSRFRYVCVADAHARYAPSALLESMHAAVEDPAVIVGVSTSLGPSIEGAKAPEPPADTLPRILQRLSALRSLLSRSLRRRLSVSVGPDSLPGFAIWRRDVVVESGGFALDVPNEQLEMTFRLHRHLLRSGQPYRMVQVAAPVGAPSRDATLAHIVERRLERQQSMVRTLWHYRAMIGNPRYRRIGLLDLPRYLFAMLVVPWLELLCMLALPFAVATGVLTLRQLVLAVCAIGFGNGVLLCAAMLLAPWPREPQTLARLLALCPFEVFLSRPVQLYSRLVGVLRALLSKPVSASA